MPMMMIGFVHVRIQFVIRFNALYITIHAHKHFWTYGWYMILGMK